MSTPIRRWAPVRKTKDMMEQDDMEGLDLGGINLFNEDDSTSENQFHSKPNSLLNNNFNSNLKVNKTPPEPTVTCPICNNNVLEKTLNSHIDDCLTEQALRDPGMIKCDEDSTSSESDEESEIAISKVLQQQQQELPSTIECIACSTVVERCNEWNLCKSCYSVQINNSSDVQSTPQHEPVSNSLLNSSPFVSMGQSLTNTVNGNQHNPLNTIQNLGNIQNKSKSDLESLECSASHPFAVHCPYPSCNTYTEARNFPSHLRLKHATAPSHAFYCPICQLTESQSNFKAATNQLNLLTHITSAHSDLIPTHIINDQRRYQRPIITTNAIASASTEPNPNTDLFAGGQCNECGVNAGHLTSCRMFRKGGVKVEDVGTTTTTTHTSTQVGRVNNGFNINVNTNTLNFNVSGSNTTTSTTVNHSGSVREEVREYRDAEGRVFLARRLEVNGKGECEICFESFIKGEEVARLECLCLFHKKCIIKWFDKSEKNGCPLHKENKEDK